MKIIIAPQSFKGSLTAKQAVKHIADAVHEIFPKSEIVELPIADGGDGTLQTLVDATGGKIKKTKVLNPLGINIESEWGLLGDNNKTAVIEMARSSGLALLDRKHLNPMIASSYGTGQLILEAVTNGCEKIILGIGGSATNDCGVGAARSVGFKFLDAKNQAVSNDVFTFNKIVNIDRSSVDTRIADIDFEVACDVTNTLCGKEGASFIYGPQKGASQSQVQILDKSLKHVASEIKKNLGVDVIDLEGGGAAGGMGAGMVAFFNAKLRPGVDIIFDALDVERKVMDSDLIITGEGQFDISSTYNKAPTAIGKIGMKYKIPTIGLCGSFGNGFEKLDEFGVIAKSSIINNVSDLETNMKNAGNLLTIAAREQLKAIRLGMNL